MTATSPCHLERLSEFTNRPEPFLDRLRDGKEPIFLDVDGRDEIAIVDGATLRDLLRKLDRAEVVAAIKESLCDIEEERVYPAEDVLAELARKHTLQAAPSV